MNFKIAGVPFSYNAPFTLSFSLACALVLMLNLVSQGVLNQAFFSAVPDMSWTNPLTYLRLFGHVLGHAHGQHLVTNMTIILLTGPMLEEKYGTLTVLFLAAVTAFLTGLITTLFLTTGLLGASGVAFSFIVFSSFARAQTGSIPLTFVLVAVLFLGNELAMAFNEDGVAQFAHLTGGLVGAAFGFLFGERKYV